MRQVKIQEEKRRQKHNEEREEKKETKRTKAKINKNSAPFYVGKKKGLNKFRKNLRVRNFS